MARTKEFDQTKTLEKAMHLFWQQGYEATSIQDLVAHLGISRSSLYDTYGDKYALFLAALDHYQTTQYTRSVHTFEEYGFNKAAIKMLFWGMVDHILGNNGEQGCFVVNATVELSNGDSHVCERVQDNRYKVEHLFEQAITQAQASGEISATRSAKALARFLYTVFQGIQVTAKTRPSHAELEDIVTITLAVLD